MMNFGTCKPLAVLKTSFLAGMPMLMTFTSVQAQNLVINELMASNDLAYPDAFFEYNDWMEIYNAEDTIVQLAGYHL
ncbi:MAG: hypothetical protein VYA72_04105, partial [Bacteroidota bacterium]|nr:hypothetical protein [Bacteroidota bacterium]